MSRRSILFVFLLLLFVFVLISLVEKKPAKNAKITDVVSFLLGQRDILLNRVQI